MARKPLLTYFQALADGQDQRLKQIVLFVAEECEDAPYFGLTKLNKIIWKADFTCYAETGTALTGCGYQRLEFGPAPVAMVPILKELEREGAIAYRDKDFGNGVTERRVIAKMAANTNVFRVAELKYVRKAISYYWDMTGTETSDDSHGIAWKTREDGDRLHYELAYLSDRELAGRQLARLKQLAVQRGWKSN